MTPYTLCVTLTVLVFLACLIRARLLSMAILPALLLIGVRTSGLVDTSSASHPLRVAVPLMGLSVAMLSAWREAQVRVVIPPLPEGDLTPWLHQMRLLDGHKRRFWASVIVFASSCTDIPALFTWQLPGEWVLVYVQILACSLVLLVLFLPERWLPWKVL
jgi:hypothetical protein